MVSHLTLNDTSPTIGRGHLVINNPLPPGSEFLALANAHRDLVIYMSRLEDRICILESRTWWSMLKDQIKSWFR